MLGASTFLGILSGLTTFPKDCRKCWAMLCEMTTAPGLILPAGESNWARDLPTVGDLVSEEVCPPTLFSVTQKLGSSPLSSGLSQNQNHPICSSNQCFQRGAWGDHKDSLHIFPFQHPRPFGLLKKRKLPEKYTHNSPLCQWKAGP